MKQDKAQVWLMLVLLSVVGCWSYSPALAETASECMSAKDIEDMNRGAIKRVAHVKGNNASVYVALDPIWSEPEFQYEGNRNEHRITSLKEAREALVEAGIDEVVVWRLSRRTMGAAVPFKDGCVVSGYGEPDILEKLMLMHKTMLIISKNGLDDPKVRNSIEKLLEASLLGPGDRRSRRIANTTDEIVDIIIDRLRPLDKTTTSSPKAKGKECKPPTYSDIRDGYKCARE